MKRWIAIARCVSLAVSLAACSPPAELVAFQTAHEEEWIPAYGLPATLQGLSEDALNRGMGMPSRREGVVVDGTVVAHAVYCRTRRFFRENHQDRQYEYRDGWHPIESTNMRCRIGDTIRVTTANGRVTSVE